MATLIFVSKKMDFLQTYMTTISKISRMLVGGAVGRVPLPLSADDKPAPEPPIFMPTRRPSLFALRKLRLWRALELPAPTFAPPRRFMSTESLKHYQYRVIVVKLFFTDHRNILYCAECSSDTSKTFRLYWKMECIFLDIHVSNTKRTVLTIYVIISYMSMYIYALTLAFY